MRADRQPAHSYKELNALFEQLDEVSICLAALMVIHVVKGDMRMVEALRQSAEKCGPVVNTGMETLDFELLDQVCSACPKDEADWWVRALAQSVRKGDKTRTDAIANRIKTRVIY